MKSSSVSAGINLDRNWLTLSREVSDLLQKNSISEDRLWMNLLAGYTEQSSRIYFIFFGRMFYLVRNSYGGPEVRVERG